MTVSHRKNKGQSKADEGKLGECYDSQFNDLCSSAAPDFLFFVLTTHTVAAVEPGIRYHCDACGADITLTVRVRCAGGCEDFDVCGSCFCAGVEVRQHKAWHDYRIVVSGRAERDSA